MNQNVRRKYPTRDNQNRDNQNRNNTYISSLNDNREQHEQYWGQQANNYMEIKNEITATVTNHTNKLIDNLEMKYQQMNRNMEKRQYEALEMVFDRLDKTLENIQRQNNFRTENDNIQNNRNTDNNNMHHNNNQNNRQQENRTRRTNSITTEERETTVTEPPLPFYKQLTAMSINEEPQIEQSISSGSVPTTKRPFDGTDPA